MCPSLTLVKIAMGQVHSAVQTFVSCVREMVHKWSELLIISVVANYERAVTVKQSKTRMALWQHLFYKYCFLYKENRKSKAMWSHGYMMDSAFSWNPESLNFFKCTLQSRCTICICLWECAHSHPCCAAQDDRKGSQSILSYPEMQKGRKYFSLALAIAWKDSSQF